MSMSQHGQLKASLPDYLTMSNAKSIMTLLDWPPGKQDGIKDQTDLINVMEAEEIFTDGNYGELKRILRTLRLIQAANVVEKYERPVRVPVQETGR